LSIPANLLFIGLPGSGKTTFLAALWHVLSDKSSPTTLQLTKLSGDRTYLNQITSKWRECSQVPRTNLQTEQSVVLHLEGEGFGSFDLSIPDLAGEAFKLQLTERRISRHHSDFIQAATGIILFLHPDVHKGRQLTQVLKLEANLPQAVKEKQDSSVLVKPWSHEVLPHQVQLVELLQFLFEQTENRLRVAVVVSAWDLIESPHIGPPNTFVEQKLPLLHQFLVANNDLMDHVVFGVSAQGGDITVAAQKKGLLELDDALTRIRVRQGQDTGHDITKPIAWLLGEK